MQGMTLFRATIAIAAAALASAPTSNAAHAAPPPLPGKPPPPPAIAPGARTFVVFAGRPARVRLAWPAAAKIARYRARWKQGGAQVDVELPGTATAFERE